MKYENEIKISSLINSIVIEEWWLELQKYKDISEKYKNDYNNKNKECNKYIKEIDDLKFKNDELKEIIKHYETITNKYFYWEPQAEWYDDWHWWGGYYFVWFEIKEITKEQKYEVKNAPKKEEEKEEEKEKIIDDFPF